MLFIIDRVLMELTKWNKICKINQYLNYILTIKSQNIQAILVIFLNKRKTILKNFIPKGKSPNLPLLNFPAKFRTEKKISNGQLYYYGATISLETVTKSLNSQTYNKFPGNYGLALFKLTISYPFRCLSILGKVWYHGC